MDDDPELAVLLAIVALNVADTEEADLSLRTTLSEYRLRASLDASVPLWSAAFSPDDSLVATSRDDGVSIWDWRAEQRLHLLDDESGYLTSVAFSADGALVAAGGPNGAMRVWEWKSEASIADGLVHADAVRDVTFSAGDRLIVSGSDDGTVAIWPWRTSSTGITVAGHTSSTVTGILLPDRDDDDIYGISLSPDGLQIAVASVDPEVQLYACVLCASTEDVLELAHQRITRELTDDERTRYLPDAIAE